MLRWLLRYVTASPQNRCRVVNPVPLPDVNGEGTESDKESRYDEEKDVVCGDV
jgi:hypothetical protein